MIARGEFIIIGGANLDIKGVITGRTVPATSNPGRTAICAGGVASNIARNLASLGASTSLFSVVGNDDAGRRLVASCLDAGIDMSLTATRPGSTGTYTAIVDRGGEMLVAVADMALVETITPRVVSRHRARLAAARFLVADCNLGSDTLIAIGRIAERHGVPLLIDPVSVPKARRLGEFLRARGRLFAATPNRGELARLAGFPVIDEPSLARAARLLHRRGVAHVLVGLGAEGSYLFSATDGRPFGLRLAPGAGSSRVRDVTGGGDAMVAGFAFGIASGESAAVAARRAATLAARAVGTLASAASAARGGARRMQP